MKSAEPKLERIAVAERYFRGIYGGDTTVVNDLASEDVVVSYPIFKRVFGADAIHGRKEVKDFVVGFGKRWADPQFEFHEALSDGDRVVLVWSFRARNAAPSPTGQPETNQEHRWGGITFLRFDKAEKIVAEIGEESEPGPIERLENTQEGQ